MTLAVGDRVVHPDWVGSKRAGVVASVANVWREDVRFDGWDRTVRAAVGSLEKEPGGPALLEDLALLL